MAESVRIEGVTNKGVIGKGAFGVVHLVENKAGEEVGLSLSIVYSCNRVCFYLFSILAIWSVFIYFLFLQ